MLLRLPSDCLRALSSSLTLAELLVLRRVVRQGALPPCIQSALAARLTRPERCAAAAPSAVERVLLEW